MNETPVTASEAAAEDDLEALLEAALKDIEASEDLAGLDGLRVRYLGKKGLVTQRLKTLGSLPPDERKAAAQALNQGKGRLQGAIEARKARLEAERLEAAIRAQAVDVTLPGRGGGGGGGGRGRGGGGEHKNIRSLQEAGRPTQGSSCTPKPTYHPLPSLSMYLSSLFLKVSVVLAPTTWLLSALHPSTTLLANQYLPMSLLNLIFLNLNPLPRVLPCSPTGNTLLTSPLLKPFIHL